MYVYNGASRSAYRLTEYTHLTISFIVINNGGYIHNRNFGPNMQLFISPTFFFEILKTTYIANFDKLEAS